ncbi:histone H1.8 [Peromyscus californicus insignis]|uniref:histone H1.8 n=1 Tax=Peromyscus californicus insignis TaxID=564181 RepID=UPI0022A79CC3|nr:histone H1.8 [Peromyscus californicus insignis]
MAPGSVSSSSFSSSPSRDTSPSGSPELHETHKPGPNPRRVLVGRRNPTMLRMVLEALQAREKRQGTSVVAIKLYILHKYPTVDVTRFKYLLKRALDTGMRRGLLTRPANSKAKGATGSFKLVPKSKKKRTCSSIARRGATDAKKTGPKKPTELKTDHAGNTKIEKVVLKPGPKTKACSYPAATLEKAPTKASKAKLGEVRKAPLKPDKATRAPPTANKIGQNVRCSGSRQEAEAYRKTKDVCEKSEPSASKVQNSVASLTKRKMAAAAHTETVVQGARTVHKSKAPAPPQDMACKAQPTHRVRRTKTPENSKRPGLPPKTSSKVPSKKAEAGS